jgi:phage gp46-like protein
MDLALVPSADGTAFDLAIDGYGLATESGLKSAVIVSLYTDRRADADDAIPDGTDDRRGWWAEPQIGSRLWLLAREKETADVLARAQEYAREALAWLVEDGAAAAVEVSAAWVRRGVLGLTVTIRLADRTQFADVFNVDFGGA